MAQPPYLLLVHASFQNDVDALGKLGSGYVSSFTTQLDKIQWDPHRAGDRYKCDALAKEYGDFIRKCDIRGPNGPKVFYFIWDSQKLVVPFFVTPVLRKGIEYSKIRIHEITANLIRIVEGWPDTAVDCELWRVINQQIAKINAADFLARRAS